MFLYGFMDLPVCPMLKNKRVRCSLLSSHLTSTSPPMCILNEPSGCFTDHRKSSSFSLEKSRSRREGEEIHGDKRSRIRTELEQREVVEGKWNSLSAEIVKNKIKVNTPKPQQQLHSNAE